MILPDSKQATNTLRRLPNELDSVLAELLARLLRGEAISQKDATKLMSTTRLSAFIYTLRHDYYWHIETHKESSPTNDGRISHYARYTLPLDEIDKVPELERLDFINQVFVARKERRERKGKVSA